MIYTLTRHYKWFATANLKSFHLLLFINFTLLAFSTLFFFAKNTNRSYIYRSNDDVYRVIRMGWYSKEERDTIYDFF